MAQSLATQEIASLKSNLVTLEDVRGLAKDMENGNMKRVFEECIDENVEWTFSPPADGTLGKTHPLAGVYTSRDQVLNEALAPFHARFTERWLKFETMDIFFQPSQMNDPSEHHLTKATLQMKGSAVLKKNGQNWCTHSVYIMHFDNQTKKVVKIMAYHDTAAINQVFED
ncbi:hypothetical protein FRB94_003271 [Tulasnella sp. JGI-2019a]|nr:hypothetical protein FRB93_003064 [Tulasnella sp. JGI-2019a]KAG9013201.1 hypothetical protein FRB94_003271 [Tulasnella sp. JGI-2019a]KAG9033013.1 hypothetical protein FRB95_000675 [Tulasnella sp. JGI-2019a]